MKEQIAIYWEAGWLKENQVTIVENITTLEPQELEIGDQGEEPGKQNETRPKPANKELREAIKKNTAKPTE